MMDITLRLPLASVEEVALVEEEVVDGRPSDTSNTALRNSGLLKLTYQILLTL